MKLKVRESYSKDVTTLNRIAAAVRDDDRLSIEVREIIIGHLHLAMKRLLAADVSTLGDEKTAPTDGESTTHEEADEAAETPPSES